MCLRNVGARGGGRTHTTRERQGILSPPRMPFRHPGDIVQSYRIKGFAAMGLVDSSAARRGWIRRIWAAAARNKRPLMALRRASVGGPGGSRERVRRASRRPAYRKLSANNFARPVGRARSIGARGCPGVLCRNGAARTDRICWGAREPCLFLHSSERGRRDTTHSGSSNRGPTTGKGTNTTAKGSDGNEPSREVG